MRKLYLVTIADRYTHYEHVEVWADSEEEAREEAVSAYEEKVDEGWNPITAGELSGKDGESEAIDVYVPDDNVDRAYGLVGEEKR